MKDMIRGIRWGIGAVLFFFFIMVNVQPVYAAKKEDTAQTQIEKKLTASTTTKMQMLQGKIYYVKSYRWKKSQSISLVAEKLEVKKKGWYTFRVKKISGKYSIFSLYLKKKTYVFGANESKKIKEGDYQCSVKARSGWFVDVSDGSLVNGANVYMGANSSRASNVWTVEKVSGRYFRLKNKGNGLYLAVGANGNAVVQQNKDNTTVFRGIKADKKYVMLWNKGVKKCLRLSGENVCGMNRKNNKYTKFCLKKTVAPASAANCDSVTTYPVNHYYGNSFTLKGMVWSVYGVKALTGQILDEKGTALQQKTIYPNKSYCNLSGLDSGLRFGKLEIGNYTYRVVIQDFTGRNLIVIDKAFQVSLPASATQKVIPYSRTLIDQIGHQSDGTDLEKKACASYALAYCNSILNKTAPSPHTYWVSSTNVDCVWSAGNYTTAYYNSAQETLNAAYTQVAAGKPCILRVSGTTTSQHWVTVIGYQNVTNPANVTVSNLLAIDPWDGALITVGDKYQVKTVFRLAYHAK